MNEESGYVNVSELVTHAMAVSKRDNNCTDRKRSDDVLGDFHSTGSGPRKIGGYLDLQL